MRFVVTMTVLLLLAAPASADTVCQVGGGPGDLVKTAAQKCQPGETLLMASNDPRDVARVCDAAKPINVFFNSPWIICTFNGLRSLRLEKP
jgi:hypothetical protein